MLLFQLIWHGFERDMKDQKSLNQVLEDFYWRFLFIFSIIVFIAQDSIARDDLVRAAVTGDLERVSTLIDDEGLDVNARNRFHYTVLMGATTTGHIKIVRFLKRRGANLDLQNPQGVTALILAIYQGYERVFRFLINSGANPHLSDDDGITPLFLLSHKGYLRDVKFLVSIRRP